MDELKSKLEQWYIKEIQILEAEKKKITKGWLTSIDTIRKTKRDLEIASRVKHDDGNYKRRIMLGEDLNIFSILNLNNRSQCSPHSICSGSNMSVNGGMHGLMRQSPLAIGGNNPGLKMSIGFGKNLGGLISDPNIHQLNRGKKMKPDVKMNRGLGQKKPHSLAI